MTSTILVGDCREHLRELADESVHCVVTSPPYFGLRDYGTGEWSGGDPECDHVQREIRTGLGLAAWSAIHSTGGGHKAGEVDKIAFRDVCGKCGSRREDRQIGLEPTPAEFVEALVGVFREVRRVLRADGTVWLNLGDSYNAYNGNRGSSTSLSKAREHALPRYESGQGLTVHDLKTKDLLMIPAQVALALRADGWYLRSEIIWAKPNAMPESVSDRPTSAHEKLFLLAKSGRYFYDAYAIREADSGQDHARNVLDGQPALDPSGGRMAPHTGLRVPEGRDGRGRNKRNVWEIATRAFADAHFATFPPDLVEPCVLAGTSPRVCGICAAPWRRVAERVASGYDGSRYGERAARGRPGGSGSGGFERSTLGSSNGTETADYRTTGWDPTCEHQDDTARAIVLDPFAGSGTVGVVAEWHGRDFLGVELNPEYADMARARIAAEGPIGRRAYRPEREPDSQAALF